MIDTTKYTQLLIFKRHWVLSVAVAMTVIAVVIPVALGAPNVYKAGAKLTVERQARSGQAAAGDLDDRLQTIRQDALSRARIINLIDELNLYPELRDTAPLDVVIDRVQKDISVVPQTISVGGGAQATMGFTVIYTGNEPTMVAAVANRLASFWIEQNSKLKNQQVSRDVQDLKGQLDETQSKLNDANTRMQNYMKSNASQLPQGVLAKMQERDAARAELLSKQNLQNTLDMHRQNLKISIVDESQKSGSVDSTPDQIERARILGEIEHFRDLGEQDGGPNIRSRLPKVKTLEQRIAAAGNGRSGEAGGQTRLSLLQDDLKDTETKLDDATADVSKLEEKVRTLTSQISNVPMTDPTYDGLKMAVTAAQDLNASVQHQYDRAVLAETSEKAPDSEEFKILEEARIPAGPAGPNRLSLMIGGVFFAIVLGIGSAVLRDQLDTSFHTLEELRMFTTVPVLGSIPKITTTQQKARRATVLILACCGLVVALAGMSFFVYGFAQRHEGITRIITK